MELTSSSNFSQVVKKKECTAPNRMYASSMIPLRKNGYCTLPAVVVTKTLGYTGMLQTLVDMGSAGYGMGVFASISLGLVDAVGVFVLMGV